MPIRGRATWTPGPPPNRRSFEETNEGRFRNAIHGHPAFPYGLDGLGGEGIICAHLEVVKAALLINDLSPTVDRDLSMNLFSPPSWR